MFSLSSWAFDSSQAYNVVTMSYPANQMIYNRVVLNTAQKAESTITFSVDVKNGGGRPTHDLNGVPQAYASQTDSAYIRMRFYDSGGTLVNTSQSQTYALKNYGSNAGGWSAVPGDNLHPWTTASVTYNGSLSNIWFVQIEMVGTDGAYWAGNYGPEWRVPTVTVGSGTTNLVYNPEFGVSPNSVKAQGWFNSSNSWATCGTTSGNTPCVTAVGGVTANEFGGGYDANGGSLAGVQGGYSGTLTTSTADTAAATGSTTTTAPSLCCGGSSTSFNADSTNTAKVLAFINRTTADSKINIEQIGHFNTITVEQTGTRNNYTKYVGNGDSNSVSITQQGLNNSQTNYTDLAIIGNSNNIDIKQRISGETTSFGKGVFTTITGNNNSLIVDQKNNGSHYAEISLSGNNKNVDVTQQGSASHMAKIGLSGNPTDLSLTQSGATQQFYSINFNCATAGGCAKITITQGN